MTDKEVRYSAAYVHQVLSQMAWEMLQHRPDMTAPLETKRLLTDHLRVMSRILANPELYFRFFLAEFNKITEQKKTKPPLSPIPTPADACPVCGHRQFWRSVIGPYLCAQCDPPPKPDHLSVEQWWYVCE